MTRKLAGQAVGGFVFLLVVLGITLFVAAGTLAYWQAWVYLCTFGISAGLITAYLWRRDPQLLERRVRGGPTAELSRTQQIIQGLASVAFLGMMVVPSLDHRFGWSVVPLTVIIAGDVLVALGFWVVFKVFQVNTFTAATIEVASDQRVISTGPYALVRHPMYSGALVMLAGTPLALGSWWGLVMLVPMTMVIVVRLLDEEKVLAESLPGYDEYQARARHRLLPGVW